MSLKRNIIEACVFVYSRVVGVWPKSPAPLPEEIFVLRNNDMGDLLIITPLFQALKEHFPKTKIIAAVGSWNKTLLKNNPYIDEVIEVNAPWHNKVSAKHAPNSIPGFMQGLKYIFTSKKIADLKKRMCAIGIDVLGSPQGALLMSRAQIKYRIGVKGYAGGHSGCQDFLEYAPNMHVGAFAMQFAKKLGATQLPANKPQIFLSKEESLYARETWEALPGKANNTQQIIIAPGGGYASKCWTPEDFAQLTTLIGSQHNADIIVIGGKEDQDKAQKIKDSCAKAIDLTGQTNLRESFSLVSESDLVICNSSMAMHAAAAFSVPTAIMLGEDFEDAAAHAQLWSYPDTSITLGKNRSRNTTYSPQEAYEIIQKKGWLKS